MTVPHMHSGVELERYGGARLTELTNGWGNWLQLIDLQREYISSSLVCIALKPDNTAHI